MIIHCKDCARASYMPEVNKWLCYIRDDAYCYMMPDAFCSDGILREGNSQDPYDGLIPYDLTVNLTT